MTILYIIQSYSYQIHPILLPLPVNSNVGNAVISGSTAAQWSNYDSGVVSHCMKGVEEEQEDVAINPILPYIHKYTTMTYWIG